MKQMFILVFLSICGSSSAQKIEGIFQIQRIDSSLGVYCVYVQRGDSILKIVATESLDKTMCGKIVPGGFYNMVLQSTLPNYANKLHMTALRIGKIMIPLEGEPVVWDLFVTKNLDGLCYKCNAADKP